MTEYAQFQRSERTLDGRKGERRRYGVHGLLTATISFGYLLPLHVKSVLFAKVWVRGVLFVIFYILCAVVVTLFQLNFPRYFCLQC